ncbi:Sideroflexin 1 [Aphelenchoides avenae]|nr:Sideroflexin 1 [Aphelenchus avenae]
MPTALVKELVTRPDISKPRWDQRTFDGRLKHFFTVTNPLNLCVSNERLDECRTIVQDYRNGIVSSGLTVDDLWRAKHVYDSAFHPGTGEKQFILGRMSSQVPCNMVIAGGMLTFIHNRRSVVFWQWINQTYNASVNYANRAGENAPSGQRLFVAYLAATGGAVSTALALETWAKKMPPVAARLVPFVSVSAANIVNVPIIRIKELSEGITVEDETGQKLGKSTRVAYYAIPMVVASRIFMAIPFMVSAPFIMERIARQAWYKKREWIAAPLQTMYAGFMLTFATPIGCALFPQKSDCKVEKLEKPLADKISSMPNAPKTVYYNKGL